MIKWILILLVVAAVASLLGFNTISGVAATGARFLIGIVLVVAALGVGAALLNAGVGMDFAAGAHNPLTSRT